MKGYKHFMWRVVTGSTEFWSGPERKSTGQLPRGQAFGVFQRCWSSLWHSQLCSTQSNLFLTWAAWNQSKCSHFLLQLRVTTSMQVQKASCQATDFLRGCLLQLSRRWPGNPQSPKLWSLSLHTACPRKSWVTPCSSGQTTTPSTVTSHSLRTRGRKMALAWIVDLVGASLNTGSKSKKWCD